MRFLRIILGAVLLLAGWTPAGECDWQMFTTADGLSDNDIRDIMEDSSGNIWFATAYGASCYDGLTWRFFTTRNGLVHNSVYAICQDRSGALWFGTLNGVSRYDGLTWRTYKEADGLAGDDVHAILEDRAGNLWFGHGYQHGVSRFDGQTWRTYTAADGMVENGIYCFLEDRAGNIWAGTSGAGALRFDGTRWNQVTTADGLASNAVRAIAEDHDGNLWFGMYDSAYRGGVSRFDGQTWRTYTTADGLVSNGVLSIIEDREGRLWFGAGVGASRLDGEGWRSYTTADGLPQSSVEAILEDSSGNIWFGAYGGSGGGGVARTDGVSWSRYTDGSGLGSYYVESLCEDRAGNVWVGTWRGASRYDGSAWETFRLPTTGDGMDIVEAICKADDGKLWFGMRSGGACSFDGETWRSYTTADGLANDYIHSIFQCRNGDLWFGTSGGLSRFDGQTWRTYKTADGLVYNSVYHILEDLSGNLWFGTMMGVSRFDGQNWRTYLPADGLPDKNIHSMFLDRAGNLWFGTIGGATRYDGQTWRTYTPADGLPDWNVVSIFEDRSGDLWFGTVYGGVCRFDGERVVGTYGPADGLCSVWINSILQDHRGHFWFGSPDRGVTRLEPDLVPPQTVISPRVAPLSGSAAQMVLFGAAFRDRDGISFSHSLDGAPWSGWSDVAFAQLPGLADGPHTFRVMARDRIGNVDPTPATAVFEVDATPPVPEILSPVAGEAVRDSVMIRGTASDARFAGYRVEVRARGTEPWMTLAESIQPVEEGALGGWNTASLPDGDYELRLAVADTLGLQGTAQVRVVVDNQAPWAYQTAPAVVAGDAGGDVYTTNRDVHLYFPPHFFVRDSEVDITPLAEPDLPDTLDGGVRVLAGYEISWGGETRGKVATLAVARMDGESGGDACLYFLGGDQAWRRLGGTLDPAARRVSCAIAEPGWYALGTGAAGAPGPSSMAGLRITPRTLLVAGGANEAAISFTLGRGGPVTVRVFNRAGRLVREVASAQPMHAGANLVRWDGRDADAALVEDGLYLVVVEALGEKQSKAIAVVR